MPDPVTHHVFGHQVLDALPAQIRDRIHVPIFDRALHGPDPWSTIGFYGGRDKQFAKRSGILHKTHTGAFLQALSQQAMEDPTGQVLSVLAGTVCHYCLDKWAHPYIICKAGEYDGTPQTRWQRGGHVRLERAIDAWFIRHTFGKAPHRFSIPRQILGLKQYPESLRAPLDQAYRQVYGWEQTFDGLNASLRDERRFYGLMQDPTGLVRLLLKPLSFGTTDYCVYSYRHAEIRDSGPDYLNLSHEPWPHPFAPDLTSDDSFFDLFEKALQEAVQMLYKAHEAILPGDTDALADIFHDQNYSTGLPCDDPRNQAAPSCRPLKFERK